MLNETLFLRFQQQFLRKFSPNFYKIPVFSFWKEKNLAKKKTSRNCFFCFRYAPVFSFHESAKKTGIIKTILLLLKFHSQVNSQPKFLP